MSTEVAAEQVVATEVVSHTEQSTSTTVTTTTTTTTIIEEHRARRLVAVETAQSDEGCGSEQMVETLTVEAKAEQEDQRKQSSQNKSSGQCSAAADAIDVQQDRLDNIAQQQTEPAQGPPAVQSPAVVVSLPPEQAGREEVTVGDCITVEKSSAQRHRKQHADPTATVDDVLREKRALMREIDALRARALHNIGKADESRRKEHVHTTRKIRAESAYELRKAEQEEHKLNLKLRAEQRVEEARQAAEIVRRKKEEANAKRVEERLQRKEQLKREEEEKKEEFERIFQIRRDAAAQRAANARELVKIGSLADVLPTSRPQEHSPRRVSSSAVLVSTERQLHFREVAWINPSIITTKSNAELYKDGDLLERQLRINSIRELRETKRLRIDEEKQRHKDMQLAILEAKRQAELVNQEKVHLARLKDAPVPIEHSPQRIKRNVIKDETEALRTARQQKEDADRQRRKELHDKLVASRQEKKEKQQIASAIAADGVSPGTAHRLWQEELARRAREEQRKHQLVQQARAEREIRRPCTSGGDAVMMAHQHAASFQDQEELKALRRERRKLLRSLGLPYEGDDDSQAGSVSPRNDSQPRALSTSLEKQ